MTFFGRFFLALAGAAWAILPRIAAAEETARDAKSPVVVEIFISQACSSCVPAVKLLPDLAERDDVVALSWHVDYWNMLNTKNGRWADPYSDAAYTTRQKKYNMRIRNRSSVYTPQAVIDGAWETIGSSQEKIESLIDQAAAREDRTGVATSWDDGRISFDIGESDGGGNAFLVTFKKQEITPIPRGENAGRTFDEVNIVIGLRPLGVVLRRGATLSAEPPAEGEGCALIVQTPGEMRVVAASYCPG